MDPLSAAASVVGLLAAAGKTAQLLRKLTAMADAPALVRVVLAEMDDTTVALGHLQEYLNGTNAVNSDRKKFILLEHVVATLTGAVTTYSKLEAFIIAIRIDPAMSAFDRLNYIKSNQEVESSTQRLCILIEQVVATNRDLSTRLCRLETQSSRRPIEDNLSLITAEHGDADARRSIQYHAIGLSSSFERFLHTSRAYGHCHFQHSETSLTSSDRRTNAFSTFTSLSLADISDISVFSLPIYASDISNSHWYTFGLPRQLMNPLPTLNQSSNPFGRLETGNDAEVIDRRANKPRSNAKNRERLSFQSVQRRAEKQRAIQRVDYQEAQTPENFRLTTSWKNSPSSQNVQLQIMKKNKYLKALKSSTIWESSTMSRNLRL
ncbi:hypothetical protein MMC22_000726 [Lobaria immixta]|nr:hypothetical protein [Lobaria immixta]